jgi:chromosome segregation ATPase
MFIHSIDSAYDAVQQELLVAQQRIAELEGDIASLQISHDARGIYLRNCESNENALADDLQKCYVRITELDACTSDYKTRTHDLLANIRSLETRIEHQNDRIAELESTLKEKDTYIGFLEQHVSNEDLNGW